jgi:hypothetical protein
MALAHQNMSGMEIISEKPKRITMSDIGWETSHPVSDWLYILNRKSLKKQPL